MTVNRLDQSRRLTRAARALGLTVPRGFSFVKLRASGPSAEKLSPIAVNIHASNSLFQDYAIDLRDPLTRAGLPLLVAEAAGVDTVSLQRDSPFWEVVTVDDGQADYATNTFGVIFHHVDPTEALLLYLEWLVEQQGGQG